MKKQVLLILAMAFAAIAFAQKGHIPYYKNLTRDSHKKESINTKTVKTPIRNENILFYEDFDGARWAATSNEGEPVPENAPEGWELNDYTGSGYYWRWDTLGPRGVFTSPGDTNFYCHNHSEPLHSSTEKNGFLTLEADYFNSTADCSDIGGGNGMDGDVTYTIPLNFLDQDAVHLIFEQYARLCCEFNAESDTWFEVSTDGGENWMAISVHVTPYNQQSNNPHVSIFDISNMVAGESSVIFRFRMETLSHYHWEIDDVRFVVPSPHDIKLVDYWNQYIEPYSLNSEDLPLDESQDFKEGFYHYPWFLTQNYVGFNASFVNFGGSLLSNAMHNVQIRKNGQLLTTFTNEPIENIEIGEQDTTEFSQNWSPSGKGLYEIAHFISCSQGEDHPENDTLRRQFIIGDSTVCPIDTTEISGTTSPHVWLFHEDGRGLGFQLNIPEPSLHGDGIETDEYTLSGVRTFLSNQVNEGDSLIASGEAIFIAELYNVNPVTDSLELIIQSEPRVLTLNDTSSWIHIPFIVNGQDEILLQGGQYIVNLVFLGTYRDSQGRLTPVKIGKSNKYKQSWESCIIVEADGSDYSHVNNDGAPAIALNIHFADDYPEPEHTVTFNIQDIAESPIENAIVYTGGKHPKTNENGEASLSLENGVYEYIISANGFGEKTGTFQINNETITINETLYNSHKTKFIVKNSSNQTISNAHISINGEELITGQNGMDSTYLISGTYTYTINKIGYDEYEGTLTVSDADITEIVTAFDKTNYTVNFTVQDNENTTLEGAQVNIGENSTSTNANGQATIQGNFGSNEYSVSKDGYETATGYIMLLEEAEVAVTLDPVYTVTFMVESYNGTLEGATIEIDNQSLITDASGEATIELTNGEYPYTVTKEGYEGTSETIIVDGFDIDETVSLQEYFTVTFEAFDENGDPMEGMQIFINEDTLIIDENGEASIDLIAGNYDYTAIYTIFYAVDETFTIVESDITVDIMPPVGEYSAVSFYITIGDNPAAGATITFAYGSTEADENGALYLSLPYGQYSYTVSYEGYEDITGTVVVDGASENVYIDFLGIDNLEKSLEMYPNPAKGSVYFKLETSAQISILDLSGKEVKTATINTSGSINLTGINNGVYLIRIETDTETTTKRLIIKK